MTSYISSIAGNVFVTGTTEINGQQFNTNTLFNFNVFGVRTTSTGHLVFYSYGNYSGGLYVTSLISDGYAYGINMTVGTIYKMASYGTSGYAPTINTTTLVRSAESLYSNTVIYGPFTLTINPVNNDIYVMTLNTGLVCIPYATNTNSISGKTMTAGYVYPLYLFSNAAYCMEFHPDGHLFYCGWPSGYTLMLSGAEGDTTLYGKIAKKYNYSSFTDLRTPSSTNYLNFQSQSFCFDKNKNLYYLAGAGGAGVFIYYNNSSTSIYVGFNYSAGIEAYVIAVDDLYNIYVILSTANMVVIATGTSTSIMGTTVSKKTLVNNGSVDPTTIMTYSGTIPANNSLITNNATLGALGGIRYIFLDAFTGRNLFFMGSPAIRKSIDAIPLAPLYLSVSSTKTATIDIGNLQSISAYSYSYAGGAISSTYYYSINGGTTYASFSPGNLTSYSFSVPSNQLYTVLLKRTNVVGNSSVYSTNVNVLYIYTTPFSPNSYSLSFDVATGIAVSITDTRNVAANQVYYYYYYYRVGDTATNQSADINVYANSYVPIVNGQTSYSFNIKGLQTSYYNVYIAAKNSVGGNIYSPVILPVNVICFKEDSRILTNKGYRKIQYLRKGDLVKTFKDGFKPIYKIGKKEIVHVPSLEKRTKDQLYKCSCPEYPEVFEDLVLTGCHSILVDEFANDEERDQTQKINGGIYVTDTKYRLPVCVDHRASVYEHAGKYAVYHIALENDDNYMNYGIYANGLLVESTSKRFLDEYKVMDAHNKIYTS